jgi:hypothetical protein
MKIELYNNVVRVWIKGALVSVYYAQSMIKEDMLIIEASNGEFIASFSLNDVHDMRR